MTDVEYIRNFCIIAHIDHGKSTLADRLLEITKTVSKRIKLEQFLDKLELEKERGITIKAQTVRMNFLDEKGEQYQLNLIDTPGHVDFSYEVSRSISACEGALLVVDATQGIQAQTVSNTYFALENDLEIIPVVNKIDLPSARPDEVMLEIEEFLGISSDESILVSAKTGEGVTDLLNKLIKRIKPPKGNLEKPFQALIFDSYYDNYWGAVLLIKVTNGSVKTGDKITLYEGGGEFDVQHIGVFSPDIIEFKSLCAGEVGFISAGIRSLDNVFVGDSISHCGFKVEPLPGFRKPKHMVYAGLFPTTNDKYWNLKDALEKLSLNDSSIIFSPEKSLALGMGFRAGFLGLLHMEIVQERLEREFNLDLVITAPTVPYRIKLKDGRILEINSPSELPPPAQREYMEEPIAEVTIHVPDEFIGNILKLCQNKRGIQMKIEYITTKHVMIVYKIPLSSIIVDFHDKLKSLSRGYASLDYHWDEYKRAELARLDFLINGELIDALAIITSSTQAQRIGREICLKLKKAIPRQLYEVAIQAAIGGKIISRENIKALRKDVTAKCYGGDITRKRKLLEKQKEGKKRMKKLGKIEIPQEAFMTILSAEDI